MASASALAAAEPASAPSVMRIGIVQMCDTASVETNRDRIIAGIREVADRGARVAVLPEGALRGTGPENHETVEAAIGEVRQVAAARNVYVVLGGNSHHPALKKNANWMLVIGPDGRDVYRADKIFDHHRAPMPGLFTIDGVPCHAMICADRWLRGVEEIPIQQGARISFELSNNFACEWVDPYGWYWYVPRALRNNVWVVLANTGNPADTGAEQPREKHGHSAVIAPDGRVVASTGDKVTVVIADLELREATGAEALARASHPVLRPFWDAGLRLQRNETVAAPRFAPLQSPEADITMAVAEATGNLAAMKRAVAEARARGADLVVFPARAAATEALPELQAVARASGITVVFGAEYRDGAAMYNSAFVVGPEGELLSRYDQLSARAPYTAGANPAAMWFRVKGVPAVVSVGRDGLWSELAELAAVAGAQIHVHLDCDPDHSPAARLRRQQVWANLASYCTFTATANVGGSAIWDDIAARAESQHIVKNTPKPDRGPVEVDAAFAANRVVSATADTPLIVATRRVAKVNPHAKWRPQMNPQMEPWYRIGAAVIAPRER